MKPTERTPGARGPLKGQGGAPKKKAEERRVTINARVDPATKKALDEMTKTASLGAVIDRLVKVEHELRKSEWLIAIIEKEADLRFDGKYRAEAMAELRREADGQWPNAMRELPPPSSSASTKDAIGG